MPSLEHEIVEYLYSLVKPLVRNPEKVAAEYENDAQGVLLTLHVDPSDMGLIIGKEGATSNAMRTLLRCFGVKNNARISLKIAEPSRDSVQGSYDEVVGDLKK